MAGARFRAWSGRTPGALAAALLLFVAPVLLLQAFGSRLYFVLDVPTYLVFHNLAELFGIATSLAVFAVAWFSQEQSRDKLALFLGCTFLTIGLMDLSHVLGYAGMPPLITPNSANKSTQFWIAGRLFSAVAFLGSAFVDPASRSPWLSKGRLLTVALALPVALFVAVTFFPGLLPATFVPGIGLTPLKRGAEVAAIGLYALAAAIYGVRAARQRDPLLGLYAAALAVCAASELPFAGYQSVFDAYNVIGHVYKVLAFGLFFRGSFIASVQRPRQELLAKEEALQREVAERRAAEEAKRRTEGKFAAFAEAADQVFWITRLDPEEVVYVNPAFEVVWGRSVDGVQRWTEAVHPEDHEEVEAAFARWLGGNAAASFDVQYRIVRPDGETRWIADRGFVLEREGGQISLVAGIAQDITRRKLEEEALRDSEQRYRLALDGMLEGCVLLSFDWTYLYVNEAAARHGHQQRQQMVGRRMPEVYPGVEQSEVFARYRRCMEERIPQRFEAPFAFADGSTGWYAFSVEPAVEGIFVLSLDVTERRRAEVQLLQSQKLEAVGRLAGGLAHDFNNLLTAIIGGSEFLKANLGDDALREDAQMIESAARRAAALTRQLLAFSRRQVSEPRVLEVNEVVEGMDRMLRRLIGEDIELAALCAPARGRIRMDPGQLEQVIVNLVVNARDAMPAGGRLAIETAWVEGGDAAGARADGLAPGRYAMLAVRDTGCGMDAEVQAHLFEPFFTTKEVGKGTGLGLSTVYGIVKQAGGVIQVESAPGQGSTFRVFLPAVEAPVERAADSEPPQPVTGSETILLAEDDAAVRMLMARALRAVGFAVLEAADGEEALRVAAAAGGRTIHALVSDVVMPRLGGGDLARRLRKDRPGLRVLFMSGYTRPGLDLGREPGAVVLAKPFDPATLPRRVRDLLDEPSAAGLGAEAIDGARRTELGKPG